MNLKTRSRFYLALAAALDAGLPIVQAFSTSAPRKEIPDFEEKIQALAEGRPLSSILGAGRGASPKRQNISPAEAMLLEAGESSGTLPAALRHLAERHSQEALYRRGLLVKLAYPVALLHGAALLPTLPLIFSSGWGAYLGAAGSLLLGLYGAAFVLWATWRMTPLPELVLRWPLIGTFVRSRALADYAFVLGSLISSGAPMPDSLKTAAQSVRPEPLRAAGLRVAMAVRRGQSLSQSFAPEEEHFGSLLVELISTGEASGQLDKMLAQVESTARRDAEHAGQVLAIGLSAAALAVAAFAIASVVIGFWSDYAEQFRGI